MLPTTRSGMEILLHKGDPEQKREDFLLAAYQNDLKKVPQIINFLLGYTNLHSFMLTFLSNSSVRALKISLFINAVMQL